MQVQPSVGTIRGLHLLFVMKLPNILHQVVLLEKWLDLPHVCMLMRSRVKRSMYILAK